MVPSCKIKRVNVQTEATGARESFVLTTFLMGHQLRGHELMGHQLRGHELMGHELMGPGVCVPLSLFPWTLVLRSSNRFWNGKMAYEDTVTT